MNARGSAMTPLNIHYFLETTELSGGVRVVLDQARALTMRGHRVIVRANRGDHTWYPYPVEIQYRTDFSQPLDGTDPDVVIGTFWTTIGPAMDTGAPLVVHLCQGCEWLMPEYAPMKADIQAAYAMPIPKITIGDWLSSLIFDRFGRNRFSVKSVGQIVDKDLYEEQSIRKRRRGASESSPWRILVVGIYEAWVKGITTALAAVEHIRGEGFNIHLTRVSTFPLSEEERKKFQVDSYHQCATPVQMARLYRDADIFLAPSRSA
ncbi:MAG: glycosyltransferase family 4 protein, partial [Deltaproteobacteria bacterium]|nr:glycosyltransferase family 4 protein [Deltaproteobacteria bacterium]